MYLLIMKKIPEWQYPFWNKWNKDFYMFLVKLAKRPHPKIISTKNERNQFLKILFSSQKMKDYRAFFNTLIEEFQKKEFDISKIIDKSKYLEIPEGKLDWAIWQTDRRICEYIDEIRYKEIDFLGSDKEFFEFILRFSLSQFLSFWQGPMLHMLVTIKDVKKIRLKELNDQLKIWDYTEVFS